MNRQGTIASLIFFVGVLASSSVVVAAPNMHPGQWEITTTMEMPGMNFSMPASTQTQCITDAELVPQTQLHNEKCQVLENRVDGDTVTWTVNCESGGGTMTSQGKVVYHGDSFAGTIFSTGSQMPSGMTQKMSGKRLGDCQ